VRADWSRLTSRLKESDAARVELSFGEIERTIGAKLPPSSQYPAFWSNSSSYAKAWKRAGYESTRRNVAAGHMGFVRTRVTVAQQALLDPPHTSPTPDIGRRTRTATTADVVLVGCVKTKGPSAARARDLYRSALFDRRRHYAEQSSVPWYILSAEHGLLAPDAIIEPYDVYLADEPDDYRRAWAEWVVAKLEREIGHLRGASIEVHAGAAYVDAIYSPLTRRGAVVVNPLSGLRQGEQLAWYTSDSRDHEQPVLRPTPPAPAPTAASRAAIIEALLAYGATSAPEPPGMTSFARHAAANELIINNPFAFLLGVIFDQGIPAERAWRAPYDLMTRLGHLDPVVMAREPGEVALAVATPPVLHRYREKMPHWLIEAARMVVAEYGGDAGQIWSDSPTARDLQARLRRFDGIGQKKAAMAVELLERNFGVPTRELDGSDVAYDIHVRRVFLRTGLAEFDDLDHMVDVARRANPTRPGAIDDPAWRIGRQWCHAGRPHCEACVLGQVCPRDLARTDRVRGP
jgi:uncharacterized HhH-GPD family protein